MSNPRIPSHREFFRLAIEAGQAGESDWRPVPGFEGTIDEVILADTFDAPARTGSRTRLARWRAGALLPQPVVHDFHEQVFLVAGDLVVGCDAAGRGGERFDAFTFARRPAGVLHGPFTSRTGCLMLEFQHFG